MKSAEITNLGDAIENLYAVFAPYKAKTMVGCPCCTSEEHGKYLASLPVRSIARQELGAYAFKAMTTWGSVGDFKHFLPRVFELSTDDNPEWLDLEVVFGKLRYGGWNNWPECERQAIAALLRMFWNDVLSRYPHVPDVDQCLCSIAQAVEDIDCYLAQWANDQGEAAARHLAYFVQHHAGAVPKKSRPVKLQNAFWNERVKQADQVLAWLLAPDRSEYIEQAYSRFASSEIQVMLSVAVGQLKYLRHLHSMMNASEDHGD